MSDPICAKCKHLRKDNEDTFWMYWECAADPVPNFITGIPDKRNCHSRNQYGMCESYEEKVDE